MALVVVQHLDPTHKGVMPELLQRATTMKVVQVRDRHAGEARLRLRDPAQPRHVPPPRRRCTSSSRRPPAACASPSTSSSGRSPSTGTSGASASSSPGWAPTARVGLRAIKEAAGLVLVQEPSTAKFDSMPRSAIAAGLADVVAPVAEPPGEDPLLRPARPAPRADRTLLPDGERSALEKIAILLRARTGHDFSLYKKSTVLRRIERRMGIHQIDRIATYVRYLQKNPQEVELLFRELLIGVTSFFRDPAAWDQLRDEALVAAPFEPAAAGRAAGLERRLLDGRGGLLPRHRLPRGAREGRAPREPDAPGLRHRSRPRRDRPRPPGRSSRRASPPTSPPDA